MPISPQNPQIIEDQVFLRKMRRDFGVLVDIKESEIQKVTTDKGTVITPCADGDIIYELLTHHRKVCEGSECHHSPALNGGPLLFSDSMQLDSIMRSDGEVLLRHSFQGREIKGVETFICYGHAPCAAAVLNNVRADQLVEHYLRGKDRVRAHARMRTIPLKAVGLWMHVHWIKGGQRRTYVVKRDAWNAPNAAGFRGRWNEEPKFRAECVARYWNNNDFWQQKIAA